MGFVSFNEEVEQYLCAAVLRPGNATAAVGAVGLLRRLVKMIRSYFPETGELCRRDGIAKACFYRRKSKFGGLELSEARRLRQLEEENRQLKHIVAEQAVDIRALKAVVAKKW
jgi:putative transposase